MYVAAPLLFSFLVSILDQPLCLATSFHFISLMEIHDQQNLYSTTGSSSFHFNSFLGLVTSDDDEEDDNDVQDTYIEIALEPPPQNQILPPCPQDQEERLHEEELQPRVSFSSRVFPFPGQRSSEGGVQGNNNSCPDDQAISSDTQGTPKIRFRAAMNRFLRFFPSTSSTTRSWELLVGSRGEANDHMTSTSDGRSGVVGNFLVKLRATTFQMLMASLLKLREFTSSSPEKMSIDQLKAKPRKAQRLRVKPFRKLMQNIPRERSKVISEVINLKGRRLDGGVLFNSKNGREKKTKSCPASVRSSPSKEYCCKYEIEGGGSSSRSQNIHFAVARDNSVQAAIAHCKKSLGGPDDFHF